MIGPKTKVMGLVMTDPRAEGHVTRLYNYLFGFNGLDAAYVSFLVRSEHLELTLNGIRTSGQTELLHLAPAHQAAAARWARVDGLIDTVRVRGDGPRATLGHPDPATWLDPDVVCARALRDSEAWFGRALKAPPDWLDVVDETTFRPCKLTHDDFEGTPP